MKKVLKTTPPPIASYMTDAPLLSIISDDNELFLPWFFYNFSQICVSEDGVSYYNFQTNTFNCSLLESYRLSKEILFSDKEQSLDRFVNFIDNDYYILPVVDTYHISLYTHFGINHVPHPIFIFGYDTNESTLFVGDFFDGKYQEKKVSFIEMKNAIASTTDSYWINGVMLYKKKENSPIPFNQNYMKTILTSYLSNTENSLPYHPYSESYLGVGIDIFYNKLLQETMKLNANCPCDIRVFSVNFDHKKVMRMLVEYLNNKEIIYDRNLIADFHELEKEALIIRNLVLKTRMKYKEKDVTSIEGRLDYLYNDEKKYLKKLVEML